MAVARDFQIQCMDGMTLSASYFSPSASPKASVIFCSALGVARQFYRPLAEFMSSSGFGVFTFDYRGVGGSGVQEGVGRKIGMAHWGRLDINAVLDVARKQFPGRRTYLLGHSCGGQLFGLAPNSKYLSGAILVAATLPSSRYWPFPMNLGLQAMWRAVVPALCSRGDRFPGRALGIANMDLPSGVVAQWASWARMDDFLFSEKAGLDTHYYDRLRIPMLAVYATDDRYAPAKAVQALNRKYYNANVKQHVIEAGKAGMDEVGHFGYFRDRMRDTLWRHMVNWLNRTEDAPR